MDADKFKDAVEYNAAQLSTGTVTAEHLTTLTLEWQEQNSQIADGKCGPVTREAILQSRAAESASGPAAQVPFPGIEFHDRRKFAAQAHGPGGKWPVTDRPLSKVTGICLHQTACVLGERPERWDTVGCHIGITRSGKVIWLHDFDRKVVHGNGWNNGTVGIEIDGLYAGIEGDPSTVWDNPATAIHEQAQPFLLETARAAQDTIRWIASQVPGLKVLVAHRQSSGSRRNDPGSAIWQQVALPMMEELKLSDGGIGFKLDDGYPIPQAWDPRCAGVKY